MLSKGSLLGIIAGSITYWVLEGLWMGVVMAEHYRTAYAGFASVMRPEESMNPAIWFVNTTLFAIMIVWVLKRGEVSVRSGATVGAVLGVLITASMEWMMNAYFMNYPLIPTSVYGVIWEAVSCGATGAVIGLVLTKMKD